MATAKVKTPDMFIPERIQQWAYWITEREIMRKRKEEGAVYPFSRDPVMANTRWCNVRRMDDKVSIWLMQNWYPGPLLARDMPAKTLVMSALAARMINRPETLAHITGGKVCLAWDYERFHKRMYEVKASGQPVFTNAYIINGASGGPKIEQVLKAIDKCYNTKPFHFLNVSSMQETATALHSLPGVGSFIAGQVVADLRWVLDSTNAKIWTDRMAWAPPGPGSSRGMKYLTGLAGATDMEGRGKDMSEKQFLQYLPALVRLAAVHPKVGPVFRDRKLEAHDIQNTLCELSKYIRVSTGGHAKNKYPPRSK